MNGPSETQILCEGYHDRAFWAGWLLHLGCSNEGFSPGTTGFPQPDPWGGKIGRGHHAYASTSKHFIRVVPCAGKTEIRPAARLRLKERAAKLLVRLVINVDSDVDLTSQAPTTGLRAQDVLDIAKEFDPQAALTTSNEIVMDAGTTTVSLVRWETSDGPAPGIPNEQTLERLVCAAIVAAYPARANAVETWIQSRPEPPQASPKEFSWSYMAGWYAEHGCDDFFKNLWRDASIARELEARLKSSGAWSLIEPVAQ